MRFDVSPDLDPLFKDLGEPNIDDEIIMSMLEGTAEEICILDYNSIKHISKDVIHKMYTVVDAVNGMVNEPLKKRYHELWEM